MSEQTDRIQSIYHEQKPQRYATVEEAGAYRNAVENELAARRAFHVVNPSRDEIPHLSHGAALAEAQLMAKMEHEQRIAICNSPNPPENAIRWQEARACLADMSARFYYVRVQGFDLVAFVVPDTVVER